MSCETLSASRPRIGIAGAGLLGRLLAWTLAQRGNELFPQQSVSKLWVALSILDAVDQGRVRLDQPVRISGSTYTLRRRGQPPPHPPGTRPRIPPIDPEHRRVHRETPAPPVPPPLLAVVSSTIAALRWVT